MTKISPLDEIKMKQALERAVWRYAGQVGNSVREENLDRCAIMREEDYENLEVVENKVRLAVPVRRMQDEQGVYLMVEIAGSEDQKPPFAVGCCGGKPTPTCHVGFPCPHCGQPLVLGDHAKPTEAEQAIQFTQAVEK